MPSGAILGVLSPKGNAPYKPSPPTIEARGAELPGGAS